MSCRSRWLLLAESWCGLWDFALAGSTSRSIETGQHWFLELNPNGEWGWLQRAGLPIAAALAEVLTGAP